MRKFKFLLLTAAIALVAACGGGSDNSIVAPGGGGPGGPATVASLTLLTSSPQIPSDGSANATITALVRDNNNNVMKDVPVTFTANSGSLVVAQPATTDDNGLLTASLGTAGDPTNRSITVNALAGTGTQANVTVNVIGTAITITGPASLPLGASGSYTILVANAGGAGIANRSVSISSARANGIAPQTQLTTDAQGKAAFTLAANNSGDDTITVTALGIQATQAVAVSSDTFTFTAPAANTEVALGANVVVTTNWKQNNAAVANQPITFSATRGTVSAATVNTDASGNASITMNADNAGPAVVTATNATGTSVQLNIEFVAITPTSLELQATPFTVATNDQSTITAIVRDAAGNLVKNKAVAFVLNDTTGGALSVAQATTNSQGRAQTFYNASATTSAVGGVHVNATVQGFPAVTDQVDLTVAQRAVFISLGTGNTIEEPNQSQYKKEWAIQVTDAQGNGVDLVNVSVSVLSERYWDGTRAWNGKVWVTNALPPGCVDEDIVNRNGVLDPGEDVNGNGRLEAGNRVTAVARVGGGSTVTTDSNGFALVDIYYAQDLAYWLQVTLEAKATVQGTEFRKAATFVLEGLAADFSSETVAPPGLTSPFGVDGNCATPPPQ
jgi:hypothetical protein